MKEMKYKLIFILTLTFIAANVFSQEQEGDSVQYKRMQWFFDHRKDHNGIIPLNAYYNAMQQKKALSNNQGMSPGITSNWVLLGPKSGHYNGYTAGRCQTVLINYLKDPSGNTAYLAEANGGLWKTTNLWTSNPDDVVWTPLTWNSPVIDVLSSGSFTIDPNDLTGKTIYYGTGEDIEYTSL